jgi:hypothetical protein
MVMQLTIVAVDSAGKVDNLNLWRTNFQLRFACGICCLLPTDCGVSMRIWSGADGDVGNGNGNVDSDGVSDSDHSTRST